MGEALPDLRFIIGSMAAWEAYALDPAGDGSVPSYIVEDTEQRGVYSPADGVSIYQYVDQDNRLRVDVRLFGPMAVEDDRGEIEHPTRGEPIRDSKSRKAFRDAADDTGRPGSVRTTRLIQRKRPTYDRDGNGTGEEVWASGNVPAIVDRGVTLLGDEYDGQFGNAELIEHTWL